ncbi:hypothetical protein F5J12DRAFT_784217 [Pisolithus orientalis]|uniref:uncharacterized protein n=1 Tax=Pisolithus orientalis TaxID=936130 RepID=UPI00222558F8|nr:uncharacterized protein F5J12DRAFT_784217 [Pisolithus orientalis]KAI6000968.1 hypothetical protein F5J12DRAFT_784217 [Pisolithus orientalis]
MFGRSSLFSTVLTLTVSSFFAAASQQPFSTLDPSLPLESFQAANKVLFACSVADGSFDKQDMTSNMTAQQVSCPYHYCNPPQVVLVPVQFTAPTSFAGASLSMHYLVVNLEPLVLPPYYWYYLCTTGSECGTTGYYELSTADTTLGTGTVNLVPCQCYHGKNHVGTTSKYQIPPLGDLLLI